MKHIHNHWTYRNNMKCLASSDCETGIQWKQVTLYSNINLFSVFQKACSLKNQYSVLLNSIRVTQLLPSLSMMVSSWLSLSELRELQKVFNTARNLKSLKWMTFLIKKNSNYYLVLPCKNKWGCLLQRTMSAKHDSV